MNDQPNIIRQLVELAAGELTGQKAAELHARILSDPSLRAEYDGLEEAVRFLRAESEAEPPAPLLNGVKRLLRESRPGAMERLADGLRRVVASLDFDTRLTPAVAGIRGAAAGAQIAFSCDEADIDLEVMQAGDAAWRVAAQIDSDEHEAEWSVTIVDRTTGRVVITLDATDGTFRAELMAGSYTLQLRRADLEIEVGPLQIP